MRDITGSIGQLYGYVGDNSVPMYSYERPANMLWQAVFSGLRKGGMTEDKAIEWLQSKGPRHALDGSLGDTIRELGESYGLKVAKS